MKSNDEFLKDEYAFDFKSFTTNYFEYEQGQKHKIARSRIKDNLSSWKSTGASLMPLKSISTISTINQSCHLHILWTHENMIYILIYIYECI